MPRPLTAPPRLDAALAVALFAAKLVTLAAGIQASPEPLGYLLAPIWTLPLAWRSRYPVGVACVVVAAPVLEVAFSGYHDSVVALAVFLLLPYSVAAHAARVRRMLAGLAVTAGAGAVPIVAQSTATTVRGWVLTFAGDAALLLVAASAGIAVRQQRLRARTLELLAEQLEREREERARTAIAEERTRIARELHDEVAHAMSVIAVQADAAEGALAHDPALVRQPLVAIRDTARDALTDMRRVLGMLRTDEHPELAPEPGLARASVLLDQARAEGIAVEVRLEGDPVPLPPAVDLAAYRVLQEGLTNVRKHAAARSVEVVLRYDPETIDVEVTDDGDGSGAGGGTGRGLAGVRERVALLGGDFVAGPRARGFTLRVTLPLG